MALLGGEVGLITGRVRWVVPADSWSVCSRHQHLQISGCQWAWKHWIILFLWGTESYVVSDQNHKFSSNAAGIDSRQMCLSFIRMKVESVHWSATCVCVSSVISWLSLGKGLGPAALRSDWLIAVRNRGHGSLLLFRALPPLSRREPLLLQRPDANISACSGLSLSFMSPWLWNDKQWLEAVCGKATVPSLFMSGSWPKWVYWLQLGLSCMTRPGLSFIASLRPSLCAGTIRWCIIVWGFYLAESGLGIFSATVCVCVYPFVFEWLV